MDQKTWTGSLESSEELGMRVAPFIREKKHYDLFKCRRHGACCWGLGGADRRAAFVKPPKPNDRQRHPGY